MANLTRETLKYMGASVKADKPDPNDFADKSSELMKISQDAMKQIGDWLDDNEDFLKPIINGDYRDSDYLKDSLSKLNTVKTQMSYALNQVLYGMALVKAEMTASPGSGDTNLRTAASDY